MISRLMMALSEWRYKARMANKVMDLASCTLVDILSFHFLMTGSFRIFQRTPTVQGTNVES